MDKVTDEVEIVVVAIEEMAVVLKEMALGNQAAAEIQARAKRTYRSWAWRGERPEVHPIGSSWLNSLQSRSLPQRALLLLLESAHEQRLEGARSQEQTRAISMILARRVSRRCLLYMHLALPRPPSLPKPFQMPFRTPALLPGPPKGLEVASVADDLAGSEARMGDVMVGERAACMARAGEWVGKRVGSSAGCMAGMKGARMEAC
mmetsp:Transcript_38798/g.64368  ORF Transcript_38798/g.64368 Transcript_38798/m.64368 type:complete len:205 (+) Transcript_38798:927-1541(+)